VRITARELNRATLSRQLLLAREPLSVADAVRRVVALQAQQPASPYLALWNRLSGFDPAELDAAFARHQVVRATLMRITMHAVHAADHQAFREAMEPTLRVSRLGDPRFTSSGLTSADADTLMGELLDYAGQPRTAAECGAWIEQRLGTSFPPTAWRMLRQYAPLWHVPAGEPWSFGTRVSFTAARPRPVLADSGAVPGRARTGGLPPLPPLVGQAAGRRYPAARGSPGLTVRTRRGSWRRCLADAPRSVPQLCICAAEEPRGP
jgi:Winged helix DNA-binding domain